MSATSSGPVLQNQFKELILKKNFVELARKIEKTNTQPSDNIVRIGYNTYLQEASGSKVKLFFLMKLKEITGVKPDDDVMKTACEIALGMDSPLVLEAFLKRTEAEVFIFREMGAALQRVYNVYINEGRFKDLAKLMEVTRTKPDEQLVKKGYQDYLEEAKFISFTGLKKQTGVEPDTDVVHQVYFQYQSNYLKTKTRYREEARTWLRRLHKLKKITRIDPPEGLELDDPSVFGDEGGDE